MISRRRHRLHGRWAGPGPAPFSAFRFVSNFSSAADEDMNYRPIVPAAMSLVARHERVWHRGDGFGYSDRSVKPRTAQHLLFAALIGAGVLQWSVSEAQESAAVAELQAAVQAETRINQDSAESQRLVSGLAQQTADLLEEYRSVVRETEALKIYNDNLERLVTDQREEVRSINRQLSGLEETNRNVVPLMLEMIETLGRIVEADIPFRIDERRARVDRLRRLMGQAEVVRPWTSCAWAGPCCCTRAVMASGLAGSTRPADHSRLCPSDTGAKCARAWPWRATNKRPDCCCCPCLARRGRSETGLSAAGCGADPR
jgi:hypothetical protein